MALRFLAVIVVLSLAASCRPTHRTCAERPLGDRLVVTTFNIRYGTAADGDNRWERRRDLVVDVLREGGDILGLQEALPFQVEEVVKALPGHRHVSRAREEDPAKGEACPIFWRSDRFDLVDHGTFWLSERPETPGSTSWDAALPRIATFVRLVERSTGRGLCVYNMHLDHRGERSRMEAARLIVARIAARPHPSEPVILLGDFNAGPGSVAVKTLLDAGLVDAWRAANPDAPEQGTFSGWKDRVEGDRIDFVLVSPGLAVRQAVIDTRRPAGRWPSDHLPVRVEVAWSLESSAGK
ncbi:MAG: hypothetical protein RL689_218 [Planctomycetota bacterium]|jgi:endonuclease/exonuclease/phosphatase family metal-dependent hydrolase